MNTADLEFDDDGVPLWRWSPTADYHALHAQLRAAGPVARVALPGVARPFWMPTTHTLTLDLLADSRISKDWAHWTAYQHGDIPEGWAFTPVLKPSRSMLFTDGAEHDMLKRPVTAHLTPRLVRTMEPLITGVVERFAGAMPQHTVDGVVDLRAHYAELVPLHVICTVLGIPESMHTEVRELVDVLFSINTSAEEAARNEIRRVTLLNEVIEIRRRDPGDDLTSALVGSLHTGTADPGEITRRELADTLWVLVAAGQETTRSAILNGAHALLSHPDQLQLVLDAPDRGQETIWAAVVRETLRAQSPVGLFPVGYNREPVELGGHTIPAGEGFLAAYAAVGHDPAQHGDDADQFDITRTDTRRNLAFGAGPHACPGAHLARAETEIALKTLFTRYPELTLAGIGHEPVASLISHSVAALPIRLHATAGSGPDAHTSIDDHAEPTRAERNAPPA